MWVLIVKIIAKQFIGYIRKSDDLGIKKPPKRRL